jgi:hypothetical protein
METCKIELTVALTENATGFAVSVFGANTNQQ